MKEQNREKRHRVIHVISELRPGGVELRTLELLTYLQGDSTQHEVVTITGRAGELESSYRSIGVKVTPLSLRSLAFPHKFVKFLRATKADVVHSHINHSSGLMVALAKLAGVSIRISHYRSDTPPVKTLPARLKRSTMKYLTDRFATVIAGVSPTVLSRAWSDKWEEDSRCRVLLNGFEESRPSEPPTPDLREELGLNNDEIVILHVGRGIPTKNRHRAITILSALTQQDGPKYRLVFVGRDGANDEEAEANRDSLKNLAKRHDVESLTYFAGEREDMERVLRSGDILLVTSRLEGLPGVILEAAAAKLPIVSNDLPGARFIAENGVSLALVALVESDDDWASAIKKELCISRDASRTFQQDLQSTIFAMDNVAKTYQKVWAGR